MVNQINADSGIRRRSQTFRDLVSEAHLKRYLSEFDFRYSNRIKLGLDDVARADLALQGVKGKRLTYQTTRSQWAA
jgi:hypothetical protein